MTDHNQRNAYVGSKYWYHKKWSCSNKLYLEIEGTIK